MIQEYLFVSDEKIEDIKKYNVKDVKKTCVQIKNTNSWIVTFSIKSDSMESAKVLSNANDYIVKTYKPTVLMNGSAAYFTKRLYPLAADFERSLRKLLYLKTVISKSKAAEKYIQNLEEKNLDDIKAILFYDKGFYENVHKVINQKKVFRKDEILSAINNFDEKTVWQALFPDNPPKHLKEQFSTIMLYRNDIMHSHNINLAEYESIKTLFEQINEEISTAINNLLEQELDNENAIEFDQSLGQAIEAQTEEALYKQNYYALLTGYLNSSAIESARQIAAKIDFSALAKYQEQTQEMVARMDFSKLSELEQQALGTIAKFNSPEFQKTIDQAAKALARLSMTNYDKATRKEEKDKDGEKKPTSDDEDKGDKE